MLTERLPQKTGRMQKRGKVHSLTHRHVKSCYQLSPPQCATHECPLYTHPRKQARQARTSQLHLRPRMVRATEGVLVTCDGAMRMYILHLNEQLQQDPNSTGAFVISDELDETHLLVKEDAIQMLQEKMDELQRSNTFSRPAEPAAGSMAAEKQRADGDKRQRGKADTTSNDAPAGGKKPKR